MSFFHGHFAKLFRDSHRQVDEGQWRLDFAGRQLILPLRPERFWLDWDAALSTLGHETEIKRTYASLILSSSRPELFIDVGASYGTHSILFLIHGIAALSFEPNVSCHEYFRELCALNRVTPRIESVALADGNGAAELSFPEAETWLGTTDPEVRRGLSARTVLTHRQVQQVPLDRYLSEFRNQRILVKIDTEGNEGLVLRGAVRTLERCRPVVIFESFPKGRRDDLFAFFCDAGYGVVDLPWVPGQASRRFNVEGFVGSKATNFGAVPIERIRLGAADLRQRCNNCLV
jgi:FkbM family methyltransferase